MFLTNLSELARRQTALARHACAASKATLVPEAVLQLCFASAAGRIFSMSSSMKSVFQMFLSTVMPKLLPALFVSACLATSAHAVTFDMSTATGLFAPSFRGSSNTIYLGWDSFDDPNFPGFASDVVINDNTPDVGTYAGSAALIVGNTTNDHISSGGNIYSGETPLNETITAPTDGTPGTGFTTLIVQGITAFGPFGGPTPIAFSSINGVSPTVVVGDDAIGSAQFWAKYEIPGNAATYSFTMTSVDTHESIGLLVFDSLWSANGFSSDIAVVPEPASIVLSALGALGLAVGMRRKGKRG